MDYPKSFDRASLVCLFAEISFRRVCVEVDIPARFRVFGVSDTRMGRRECAADQRGRDRTAQRARSNHSQNQDQLSRASASLWSKTLALLANLVSFSWTSSRPQPVQWRWRDARPAMRTQTVAAEMSVEAVCEQNGRVVISDSPKQHRRSFLCGRRNGVKRGCASIAPHAHAHAADCECALPPRPDQHANGDVTPIATPEATGGSAGGVWSYTPWRAGGYTEFRADFGAKCARFVESYIYRSPQVTSATQDDVTENNNRKSSQCACKSVFA